MVDQEFQDPTNQEFIEEFRKYLGEGKAEDRASLALSFIYRYGGFEGGHHKAWLVDQVLRILAGEHYDALTIDEEYDDWDTGIAP